MRDRSWVAERSGVEMAFEPIQGARVAVKRPSFLKKLKEQQRRARADEKREARRARKQAKAQGELPNDEFELLDGPPGESAEEADSETE